MNQDSKLNQNPKLAEGKPFVSIVLPAFNEASIMKKNIETICLYMSNLERKYHWELIVVNDGSSDDTGAILELLTVDNKKIKALHHKHNAGIGQAFITAFKHCQGDYVVTMDMDLSYSPDHINILLDRINDTRSQIVIASPYRKGGKVSNVPFYRKVLSRFANRFLSFLIKTPYGQLTTLTGMVRAYEGEFLAGLKLRSRGVDINCEIIEKALILGARIEEIPAHLNWHFAIDENLNRQSSARILRSIKLYLLSGFMLNPFLFFIIPGILSIGLSICFLLRPVIHSLSQFINGTVVSAVSPKLDQSSLFVILGGLAFMIAILCIAFGLLAMQNKRYYEDQFYRENRWAENSRQAGRESK